jgi:hypothetical protein
VRFVISLGRRTFLLATGALAVAACGGGSDGAESSAGADDSSGGGSGSDGAPASIATDPDGFTLAQRFDQSVNVPGLQRLPFSLADDQALLSDGPDVLYGEVRDADGAIVIPAISAQRRRVTEGLAYWDFHPQLDTVGIYYLVVDGGSPEGAAIQINDPASVTIPYPGTPLPPFDTPTTADPGGVDPICTRLDGGPCPFHAVTLSDALSQGKPVAYLIGTPAHCQFGTCAPGLEFLIEASTRVGDRMVFVHAEVYTDDTATVSTPAVEAYDMTFEPSLFLADSSGTVITRLDAAWDQSELDEALDALLA